MKLLICGDRAWVDQDMIRAWIKKTKAKADRAAKTGVDTKFLVITGGCSGADVMAERACDSLKIKSERYPAQWGRYGASAGPIRNTQMLKQNPDLVLAFHSNLKRSRGTRDMIRQAVKAGVKTIHIKGDGSSAEVLSYEQAV